MRIHPWNYIEFAFFLRDDFHRLTEPYYTFELFEKNAPPVLSFSGSKESKNIDSTYWFLYDDSEQDEGQWVDGIYCFSSYISENLLSLCLLMTAIYIEQDQEILFLADSFSKDIFSPIRRVELFQDLTKQQVAYLLGILRTRDYAKKYFVLAYARESNLIQDVQKDTASLGFFQLRYPR